MMNRLLSFLMVVGVAVAAWGDGFVSGGRGLPEGFAAEVYGGYGGVRNVEGRVEERRNGESFPTALNFDLSELGVDDDDAAWFWGARLMNNWVTFLFDYRYSSVRGAGTSEDEFRVNVSGFEFGGEAVDFLLVPAETEYKIDATSEWMGGGVRVTPLTLNAEGRLRMTPWVHLGLQYIQYEYVVDAGTVAEVQMDPDTRRVFVREGRARSEERGLIPEYGLGGELRWRLHPPGERGVEVVAEATWKFLDAQGALNVMNFDEDDFRDLDFTYEALELNVYGVFPVHERFELLAGLFAERVDMRYTLKGDRSEDGIERDISLEYTLYGGRVGLRF